MSWLWSSYSSTDIARIARDSVTQIRNNNDVLNYLLKELKIMQAALEALAAAVARDTSETQAAIVLIQGLAQQIRENTADPAALAKLADEIDANASALASAITANTKP